MEAMLRFLLRPGMIPVYLLLAAIGLLYASGATRHLSMEAIQANHQAMAAFVAARPAEAILVFIAAYTVMTALSVPGAVFLTLAGGLLFGTWFGGAATVIGATLGSTVIFYVARSALGLPLRRRAETFGGRLKAVMAGVREDAFGYILTLRLIPVMPFWLVNVACGVADAPARAYVAATFLGVMPATFIYSGVGESLALLFAQGRTPTLAEIFDWRVMWPLAGLALLAIAPTVVKRLRRKPEAT